MYFAVDCIAFYSPLDGTNECFVEALHRRLMLLTYSCFMYPLINIQHSSNLMLYKTGWGELQKRISYLIWHYFPSCFVYVGISLFFLNRPLHSSISLLTSWYVQALAEQAYAMLTIKPLMHLITHRTVLMLSHLCCLLVFINGQHFKYYLYYYCN